MNKKLRFFGIFLVLVLSLYLVLATLTTITLNTPAANENITGTYTFNATLAATETADNVTFYHNQSGSWVAFCINSTATGIEFTCINNTANLPDGKYSFNATAKNTTVTVTDVSLGVTVDNTAPNISYVSPTEVNFANKSQTSIFVNVSVADALLALDTITFLLHNSTGQVNSTSYTDGTKTINFTGLSDGVYTYNVTTNDTVGNSNTTSTRTITLDTIFPLIDYGTGTQNNSANISASNIYVNVTVTETNEVNITFNLYNSSNSNVNSTTYTDGTRTINYTGLSDGTYTYNVTIKDSVNQQNTTSTRTITLDATSPTPSSLTISSSSRDSLTITFSGASGTCTVDRSGATISSNTITETGLDCGTSYSYIITCTDSVSNAGSSSSTSFTTDGCGGGGGIVSQQPIQKKHAFSKITPGVVSIVKDFDPEIGVKQISIEVKSEAQNVKITVIKYDGKPAQVSKERTGKVYQYLEINAENLGNKLDKATVKIKVEKSWVSSNGLNKEEVLVFKFDEVSEEWKELGTKYMEEDDTYYYYDVELDSFSYFAISAKALVEGPSAEQEEEEEKSLTWLWVIIGVIIILILVGAGYKIKKRK